MGVLVVGEEDEWELVELDDDDVGEVASTEVPALMTVVISLVIPPSTLDSAEMADTRTASRVAPAPPTVMKHIVLG